MYVSPLRATGGRGWRWTGSSSLKGVALALADCQPIHRALCGHAVDAVLWRLEEGRYPLDVMFRQGGGAHRGRRTECAAGRNSCVAESGNCLQVVFRYRSQLAHPGSLYEPGVV